MNTYEVRFIKSADDDDTKHFIVTVQADNHEDALQRARNECARERRWIGDHAFYSVAVTRYG